MEKDPESKSDDFRSRCFADKSQKLQLLEQLCKQSGLDCFHRFKDLISSIESCYLNSQTNRTTLHPMSDFTNAVVYAFSVYTSIGYGTVSASTVSARCATVIYAALGIPLFFAFVKEEGNQCRIWFIRVYNYVNRWRRKKCRRCCWGKYNTISRCLISMSLKYAFNIDV